MSNNRITEFLDSENSFEPRADTECKEYDAYDSLFSLARSKVSSSPEERLYATTDANHNVTSIDDVFGSVKQRFVYDPYRKSTALTSAWASTSDGYSWVVRSQGEREDVTTNTIDSRNRVYGLGVGRWMQADNIGGYVDGANRYEFVMSSPVASTDVNGSATTKPTTKPATAPIGATWPHTIKQIDNETQFDFEQDFMDPIKPPQLKGTEKPARVKVFRRVDARPTKTNAGIIGNMSLDLEFSGDPVDLRIRWTTCARAAITPGVTTAYEGNVIPEYNDLYNAHWKMTASPYVTTTVISFWSCESGKPKHFVYEVGASYVLDGRLDPENYLISVSGAIYVFRGDKTALAITGWDPGASAPPPSEYSPPPWGKLYIEPDYQEP